MPEISRFFGIVVRMFYGDHSPPHFHARYGDDEVLIAIQTLGVLRGGLPPRALGMVLEWAALHHDELAEDWARVQRAEHPRPIPPLQ